MPKPAQTRNIRLPIADRAKLAKVFRGLAATLGSQANAASQLQVTAMYYSLRCERPKTRGVTATARKAKGPESIERDTYRRLAALIQQHRPDLLAVLQDAVFSDAKGAESARVAYRAWLRRQFRRDNPSGQIDEYDSPWYRLRVEMRGIGGRNDAIIDGRLNTFVARYETQRGHDSSRVWVAIAAAITPLLAAEDTAGIEMSWQELAAAGTLGKYLDAALRAQGLLLEREANLFKRSQHGRA